MGRDDNKPSYGNIWPNRGKELDASRRKQTNQMTIPPSTKIIITFRSLDGTEG